jgi:hypothetical protein
MEEANLKWIHSTWYDSSRWNFGKSKNISDYKVLRVCVGKMIGKMQRILGQGKYSDATQGDTCLYTFCPNS